MKNNINLIWDMDGTLIDSYPYILSSLMDTLAKFNLHPDLLTVFKEIKNTSVGAFLKDISSEENIDLKMLYNEYKTCLFKNEKNVSMMRNAPETIKKLYKSGVKNYIFTHKDKSTFEILEKYGILSCFNEIITSEENFPRKPDPEALIYLVDKYDMDKNRTFYIGDRGIDMECGKNASVRTVFYKDNDSPDVNKNIIDFTIYDIADMVNLLENL